VLEMEEERRLDSPILSQEDSEATRLIIAEQEKLDPKGKLKRNIGGEVQ